MRTRCFSVLLAAVAGTVLNIVQAQDEGYFLEHLLAEELGHVGGRIWRTFKLPPDHPGLAGRL